MGNFLAVVLVNGDNVLLNAVFVCVMLNFRGDDYPCYRRKQRCAAAADKRRLPAKGVYQKSRKDVRHKRSPRHGGGKSRASLLPAGGAHPVGNYLANRRPEQGLGKSVKAPENYHYPKGRTKRNAEIQQRRTGKTRKDQIPRVDAVAEHAA